MQIFSFCEMNGILLRLEITGRDISSDSGLESKNDVRIHFEAFRESFYHDSEFIINVT